MQHQTSSEDYYFNIPESEVLSFFRSREQEYQQGISTYLAESKNTIIDLFCSGDIVDFRDCLDGVTSSETAKVLSDLISSNIDSRYGKQSIDLFAKLIQKSIPSYEYDWIIGFSSTERGQKSSKLTPILAYTLDKDVVELSVDDVRHLYRHADPFVLPNRSLILPRRTIIFDDVFWDREYLELTIDRLQIPRFKLEIKDVFYLVVLSSREQLNYLSNTLKDRFDINLHWLISVEELLDGLLAREYPGLDRQTRDCILAAISQAPIHANMPDRP